MDTLKYYMKDYIISFISFLIGISISYIDFTVLFDKNNSLGCSTLLAYCDGPWMLSLWYIGFALFVLGAFVIFNLI